MRAAVLFLLGAVACAMIKEANSTPFFLSDILEHCPLLSYFFPKGGCCCDDYCYSCSYRCCITTSTTSTTTTTTTSTTPPTTAATTMGMMGGRRKRWIITNYSNNLSDATKRNVTRDDKQT